MRLKPLSLYSVSLKFFTVSLMILSLLIPNLLAPQLVFALKDSPKSKTDEEPEALDSSLDKGDKPLETKENEFKGDYLLAPNVPRGILFDFEAIKIDNANGHSKSDKAPLTASASNTVLTGSVETKGKVEKIELKPLDPMMDRKRRLRGEALRRKLKLKAEAKKAQRGQMIEQARNHGTLGVLLIGFGPGTDWQIQTVLRGTAAARYGLRPGDKLLAVNGARLNRLSIQSVYFRITGRRGEQKTITIRRGGRRYNIRVRLFGLDQIRFRKSRCIEYYWFLLYHKFISLQQYHRLVKKYIYFKEPVLKAPAGKLRSRNRRRGGY